MNSFSPVFTQGDFILMLKGAGITFYLTLVSGLFGTILGFLIGWARTVKFAPLYYLLGLYIEVFRTVPLIILFVLFNSGLAIFGLRIDPFTSGLISLSIYISAYVAEVVRSGIESVPPVTVKAARGLGMTYLQSFRFIVVPVGARSVLPAWTGLMLGLMKDTSLVAVLGATPPELLRASQIIITRIQEPLAILIGAGAFYFIMCHFITVVVNRYEKSWNEKTKVAA